MVLWMKGREFSSSAMVDLIENWKSVVEEIRLEMLSLCAAALIWVSVRLATTELIDEEACAERDCLIEFIEVEAEELT